jgi:siroheme synthase-like protein
MWFNSGNIFVGLISESGRSVNKKNPKTVSYYPIFVNIKKKRCVVIGGGKIALRKVRMLLDCGADVTVVSPKSHPDIAKLSKKKAIHLIQRNYEAGDLQRATIALAATNAEKINQRVAHEAKKIGILVNVADDLRSSDFIIPSFFQRGNLTIAVSTLGMSPAFAKKIRTKLEKNIGEEYALLLSLISEVRSNLKKRRCPVDQVTWQKAIDLDSLIRLLQEGQRKEAKAVLLKRLETFQASSSSPQTLD